jgi:hypothetical protein
MFALLLVVALQGLVIAGLFKSPHTASLDGKQQDAKPLVKPVKVEPIAGSPVKRVTVTAKAAERLGIRTAEVTSQQVSRKQIFLGEAISAAQPVSTAATAGIVRVDVHSDLKRLAKDQAAVVLPLSGADGFTNMKANRIANPGNPEPEAAGALFFTVDGSSSALPAGKKVRVEMALDGDGKQRNTVPYAAVIYDSKGVAWVYTNPEPLSFVRHRATIDFIEGDVAVLTDGPPLGTKVVMEGASELYGAELTGK